MGILVHLVKFYSLPEHGRTCFKV